MALPLDNRLSIGIQTIHRRTEPAEGLWRPAIDEMQALVRLVDDCGYDSLWVGDHIAFAVSILDPLLQLAQAAVVSRRRASRAGRRSGAADAPIRRLPAPVDWPMAGFPMS